MKNGILALGVLGFVALTSCSQSEVLDLAPQKEMSFSPFVGKATKASVNDLNVEGKTFGIWGDKRYDTGNPINVFDNTEMTYEGESWTYAPVKFWDVQAKYDFFAYAPSSVEATFKDNIISVENFTVSPSTDEQVDFMVSTPIKSYNDYSNAVNLVFNHTLTNVNFEISRSKKLEDLKAIVVLKSAKIKDVKSVGNFTSGLPSKENAYTKGSWVASRESDYEAVLASGTLTVENATPITNMVDMLMIPQEIDLKMDIEYTINGELFKRHDIALGSTPWEVNQKITYKLGIDANAITFTTDVVAWDDDSENVPVTPPTR